MTSGLRAARCALHVGGGTTSMSNATLDDKLPGELENGKGTASIPLVCPVCGGENAPDAVFCANPQCHKALGEFKYVIEELRDEARWHEALAERVVDFIGTSHFLVAHGVWFLIWVAINTGVLAFVQRFDEYPFGLLGIILAAEAVLIAGFVLISQNRQSAHADKRAELDYEVSVRTYREITDLNNRLRIVLERLEQK
jgi:uncharacterized membrane protein